MNCIKTSSARKIHIIPSGSLSMFSSFKYLFFSLPPVSQGGNQHSLQASLFQEDELYQYRSQRSGTVAQLFLSR